MKKLLPFFILLLVCSMQAQNFPLSSTSGGQTLREKIDDVLENLDLSEVNTGYLQEHACPLYPLAYFDGKHLNDSTVVSIKDIELMYQMILDASVGTPTLPPYSNIENATENLDSEDAIPLMIFRHRYNRIKPNAFADNLLSINNEQLFEGFNNSTSPYQEDTLFVAAPMLAITESLSMTFILDADFIFNNQANSLNQVYVDFDDGNGFQLLNIGDEVDVVYADFGKKTFKIKETGVKPRISESKLFLEDDYLAAFKDYPNEHPDTTIFFEIDGTAGAKLEISWASCPSDTHAIRKPLIYIQGFNASKGFFNLKYAKLFGAEGILNVDFLPDGINATTLSKELSDAGYDLMYIDFFDGADDIRNNAAIVDSILRFVNMAKDTVGSNEPNILIGSSAGGMVGKYALLSMENAGIDHDVKTYFTYDAQMRGGNIPLSVQALLSHVANAEIFPFLKLKDIPFVVTENPLKTFENALNSTGGRQFVVMNAYDPTFKIDEGVHGQEYIDFFEELDAMGELEVEHIALSNGSQTGVGQTASPGDKYFDVNVHGVAGILSGINFLLSAIKTDDIDPDPINFSNILSFLSPLLGPEISLFSDCYMVEDNADYLQTVYSGEFKIPIIPPFVFWEQNSHLRVKNKPAFDTAPGGMAGPKQSLADNLNPVLGFNHLAFCLAPTVSVLGIDTHDFFMDVSDNNAVVNSGITAIDGYAASDRASEQLGISQHNQKHGSMNDKFGITLVNKLVPRDAGGGIPIAPNSLVPTIDNLTFNIGESASLAAIQAAAGVLQSPTFQINTDIDIINNGALWANRKGLIGFTNITTNATNATPSHLDITIGGTSCGISGRTVRIEDGIFLIGDWAGDNKNTSDVYVEEDAAIIVEANGRLDIDQNSKLIIQSGAEVIIEGGGLLDCSWNAQVIVEAGGILRVENNGQLRPWNNGQIWVQPGGQLILNGGAQVQLWAGSGPDAIEDAPCNIKLGGPITDPDNTPDVAELVLDGQFEYSGTGYFDFHRNANIELVGDTDFAIDGYAKGYRFLKLSDGAHLNIDKNECYLRNGEVEYTESSQIDLTKDAAGRFSQVEFTGHPKSTAIDADGARFVFVGGSNFSNFEMGISARLLTDYYLNENVFIFESDFSNCKYGIYAEGLDNIRIWNTEINLTNSDLIGSGEGVHLEIVNNCYLTNSRIGNYNTGLEIWGATDFVMNGGNIHDNRIGIFLQDDIEDDVELALTNSTVDLIGKATLENNLMGIFGVAGDYIPNEGPYPMITLDCARLIENVIGIRGRDLLLNMDGGSETAPNILIENPDFNKSKILELCYYKLDLGGTDISATNNYWGESPPNVYSYIKQENGEIELTNFCTMWPDDGYDDFTTVNVGSGNVDLDFSDFLEEEPTGCGSPGTPTGGGGNDDKVYTPLEPTDEYHRKAAECLAPNERAIYEDYWQAYALYLSEVERSTADHSASRDAFSPIAKLGEDKKAKYSGFCRMLIEKARSRAGNNIYRSSASQYTNVYKVDRASVYPNPTEHRLYVKTEKNLFSNYQIVDVMGEMWQKGSIEADAVETKIEVSDLPPGVYMIQLEGKATHWKTIRFVVSE